MEQLISSTPHVLLAASMAAALTVVFVATLKILLRSFHRVTAVVLALGVTVLAVVGTAQIIFAGPQSGETTPSSVASGNALMLWPFLAWAIASLLAQLLAAAGVDAPQQDSEQTGQDAFDPAADVQPDAEPLENPTKEVKARGRPRKPSPGPSSHNPPAELKKTSSPKPSQPAGTAAAATQKTNGAAEPEKQS
jgi:hypothetical protein